MKDGADSPETRGQDLWSRLGSPRLAAVLMALLAAGWGIGLRWPFPGRTWILGTLMALVIGSALVAAGQRRPYTWARLGFLMAHLAPLCLGIGLGLNHWMGVSLRMPLAQGGVLAGHRLSVTDFRRQPAPVEAELRAFQAGGQPGSFEGEGRELPLKEGVRGRIPGMPWHFEVERVLWDAVDQGRFVESPEAEPDPLLQVLLGLGRPEPLAGHLFARNPMGSRQDEPEGRFAVVFRERFEPALLKELAPRPPKAEWLRLEPPGGQALREPAVPGRSIKVGAGSLRIRALFPDFEIRKGADGKPQPGSRSRQARDPWLQVELDPGDGQFRRLLLSARNPLQTDRLNAPHLPEGWRCHYEREGEEIQSRFVLMTLADRQVRLLEQGRVLRSAALDLGRPFVVAPGMSVTPIALFERPRFRADFIPNPEAPTPGRSERPVLRLRAWDPETGRSESQWLEIGGAPAPFMEARLAFLARLRPRPDHLQAQVRLEAATGGQGLTLALDSARGTPFRDWRLRLAEGSEGPEVLGLREPGRPFIRLGLLLLGVGSLWMFWIKPWLKRRAAEGRGL